MPNSSGVVSTAKKIVSEKRYFSDSFRQVVAARLKSFRPDIVFAEQTYMALYADLLDDIPCVMSAVDAISLAALRQADMAESSVGAVAWRYVAWQRSRVERKYFPRFDIVTAVSREDARFLSDRIGKPVCVVPNGVDTEFFKPEDSSGDACSIVFSGNLGAPMNAEACRYLIDSVFPSIHLKYPDLTFLIGGRDPGGHIARMVPPYVQLMADVPDMRDVLRHAMIYVSPIAYGTGIKNNVLQAMAMGIPVVVTPLIASPIGVVNNVSGLVAERGLGFVAAVERLIVDRSLLSAVGEGAREHVSRNLSWQAVASSYRDLFDDVIRTHTMQVS